MNKLFLSLLLCVLPLWRANSQTTKTALQICAEMTPGWNLGNTLEAGDGESKNFTNVGLSTETAWQKTTTTRELIHYVKEQGFRSVRIPCAWVMGHISDKTNCTIDAAWMARVKQVVDDCLDEGLYVLLNDHWDGGWLEKSFSTIDDNTVARNSAILKKLWTQIAVTFRDYDDHLLFGGLNEPAAEDQAQTDALLKYEQVFIDAVRATGGNNATRLLVIQGPGTDIDKTDAYMNTLPYDSATDRLAVEVHYYAPWQFWGMDKDESWGNMFYYWGDGNHLSGSVHNATFGEESYVEEQLEKMNKKFVSKGIPVIIGEYGANWRAISGANERQENHDASIRAFYKTFNEKAIEKNMVPMVWDLNYPHRPTMTIIDRSKLSIYGAPAMQGIMQGTSQMKK